MPRSIWSGTISFGLIAIPIKLFTAVRSKGVSFNQLDDRKAARFTSPLPASNALLRPPR